MGKSKDDSSKLKRSSSSSSPRDEGRIKRRKGKEDEEKFKSKKKHKSSKHRSDKDKKSGEKRKDKGRRKLDLSKINFQELSNEDYYSKNKEFATWLKEERKIFFSDLSSDKARDLFTEFVEEWNNQELEQQYYEGISTAPRTSHKWNIKK